MSRPHFKPNQIYDAQLVPSAGNKRNSSSKLTISRVHDVDFCVPLFSFYKTVSKDARIYLRGEDGRYDMTRQMLGLLFGHHSPVGYILPPCAPRLMGKLVQNCFWVESYL